MSFYCQEERNVTSHHRKKLAAIDHLLKNIITFEIEFFIYIFYLL